MINGFVDAKFILAKLYRDLQLNNEIPESDVWEWIAEALGLIGAFSQYTPIHNCLKLVSGKAKLPCGFAKLVDINYKGLPVYWATESNAHSYSAKDCQIHSCPSGNCQYTFYVNNDYLISNINNHENEEASICIVYLGIPVNDEGIPMIPDSVDYFKAIAAYITYMLTYADWRRAKCTDKVFEYSEREWLWYCGAAKGAANMPNVQQLEILKNVIKRLFPITNDYKRNFNNFNKEEKFNI